MPKEESRQAVTLLDVAQALGVSRATVSLVLRGSPAVAEKTRLRVLAAFKDMGYVYNRNAAGMRSRRTDTVAVIVNDLANTRFSVLVRTVESALNRHGFITLLGNSDESPDRQRKFLERVRQYNVDGVVICPADGTTAQDMRELLSWNIPCVCVSRFVNGVDIDYVGNDNRRGTEMATEHLIALGHKRIAMLGGHTRSSMGRARLEGYRAAMAAAGLPLDERLIVLQRPGEPLQNQGKRIITDQLRLDHPPTAAVCHNDSMAFGVVMGLRAAGLEAGRDFGVIGFDDLPEASLWEPPLTSVHSQLEQTGSLAAEILVARMKDPTRPVERIEIAPTLSVRSSCGMGRNSLISRTEPAG